MASEENHINDNTEQKDDTKEEKNNKNDSFDKVFNIQKLIHKQAGLKQLCKNNI